jgi:hypothetical protein
MRQSTHKNFFHIIDHILVLFLSHTVHRLFLILLILNFYKGPSAQFRILLGDLTPLLHVLILVFQANTYPYPPELGICTISTNIITPVRLCHSLHLCVLSSCVPSPGFAVGGVGLCSMDVFVFCRRQRPTCRHCSSQRPQSSSLSSIVTSLLNTKTRCCQRDCNLKFFFQFSENAKSKNLH